MTVPRQDVTAVPLLGQTIAPPDSDLVLTEWISPGTTTGRTAWQAPLHVHHSDDEAWYVLEGTLRVRLGDDEYDLPAGAAVVGPHGVPHTFGNPGPEQVRYVVAMSSRTHALLHELHLGEVLAPEGIRELFEKYDCELLE